MITEEGLVRELESRGYTAAYTDGMVIVAVPSYDKEKDKVMKLIKRLGYKRSFGVRPEKGEEKDVNSQKRRTKGNAKAQAV